MDNGTLVAGSHNLAARRPGVRRVSVLAALAIVLSLFVLMQRPADAAPRVGAAGAGVSAQVDPTCPILLALRDAYASNPIFFAQALVEINEELVRFGCIAPAPTTTTTSTTVRPTTTTTRLVPPVFPPGTSCATLLATRAAFVGTEFAIFIPFIDIAIAQAGCAIVSG